MPDPSAPRTPRAMDEQNVAAKKRELRKAILTRRKALTPEQRTHAGQRVLERLEAWELWQSLGEHSGVFTYVSVRDELPTRALMQRLLDRGVQVAAPRLDPSGLYQPARIRHMDDLMPDAMGVPAPAADAPHLQTIDLILVPGVAFTRHGDRLGHGGGAYDRVLAQHLHVPRVALAFDQQMVDEIPLEPHDIPMHHVVTPAAWFTCS